MHYLAQAKKALIAALCWLIRALLRIWGFVVSIDRFSYLQVISLVGSGWLFGLGQLFIFGYFCTPGLPYLCHTWLVPGTLDGRDSGTRPSART